MKIPIVFFGILTWTAVNPRASAIENGNFEDFLPTDPESPPIENFPSWVEVAGPENNTPKFTAVNPRSVAIEGATSAEVVAGTALGGGLRQAVIGEPLVFTAEVKFASLSPDEAALATSRYFAMQLKHGGAESTAQINLRVAKSGNLEVFNGTSFVQVGSLVANFTIDGGTSGIWDSETPVVNTLKVVADYSGVPFYSVTLNGVTVANLALFQSATPTNGLDAISFLGSSASKNYLIDAVVITTPTPPGFGEWSLVNAGGQTAGSDFDSDGVPNGIEYFFGETGSGFTRSPAPSGGAIVWPRDPRVGDVNFSVQTSTTLNPEEWITVAESDPNLLITGNSVTYRLPAGETVLFARLVISTF